MCYGSERAGVYVCIKGVFGSVVYCTVRAGVGTSLLLRVGCFGLEMGRWDG